MGLVDTDTLKEDLKSVTLSNGTLLNTNTVLLLLDKYPTAYDVDKVVAELEKAKTINVDVGFGTIYKAICKDVAIEIVKAGGNT